MPSELSRWAARRAPELVARAEAEAVAELKRALLDAAVPAGADPAAARKARPGPAAARPPAPKEAPSGEGVWAY